MSIKELEEEIAEIENVMNYGLNTGYAIQAMAGEFKEKHRKYV